MGKSGTDEPAFFATLEDVAVDAGRVSLKSPFKELLPMGDSQEDSSCWLFLLEVGRVRIVTRQALASDSVLSRYQSARQVWHEPNTLHVRDSVEGALLGELLLVPTEVKSSGATGARLSIPTSLREHFGLDKSGKGRVILIARVNGSVEVWSPQLLEEAIGGVRGMPIED